MGTTSGRRFPSCAPVTNRSWMRRVCCGACAPTTAGPPLPLPCRSSFPSLSTPTTHTALPPSQSSPAPPVPGTTASPLARNSSSTATIPGAHAPDAHDDYGYEVTGYPAGWSVAAARAAITSATTALLPLLGDSDPSVRIDAAYVLATAADPAHTIRTALANGFATEGDAMVRAALLLAAAEITRAHPHPPTVRWLRERWHDRAEAPEVRLLAAVGWLCLTDQSAPEELRRAVDTLADNERAQAMEALPWMSAASGADEPGLLRCRRYMLHPEEPDPEKVLWDSLF